MRDCKIDGCDGGASHKDGGARGWCRRHYKRWLRHGDPLAGGTFYGEPERFFRNVALKHKGEECLRWPFGDNGVGYGILNVGGQDQLVSRLVCTAEHGAPPTDEHQAAHSCGKGHEGCVSPHHLSWKTPTENHADKLTHGTINRGEDQHCATLTEHDVLHIRVMNKSMTQRRIAEQIGVSFQTVNDVITGRTWSWLHPGKLA